MIIERATVFDVPLREVLNKNTDVKIYINCITLDVKVVITDEESDSLGEEFYFRATIIN